MVATTPENARLYFKFRPARVLLAADPEAATHRSFGVPAGVLVEDESASLVGPGEVHDGPAAGAEINPTGELPAPQNPFAAMETLNKRDGFELTETDKHIAAAHGTQLAGHFLIDREGIIRWQHIEGAERIERPLQVPERRGDPARGPQPLGSGSSPAAWPADCRGTGLRRTSRVARSLAAAPFRP